MTSPPYNIGSKSPKKITDRKNGGFDAKSWGSIEDYFDKRPEDEYQAWQKECLIWCSHRIVPNGVIAYNHKERHSKGTLLQPEHWFPKELTLFDKAIWDRGSTHNHEPSYLYQQHEFVYLLKNVGEKHFFNRIGTPSVFHIAPERSSNTHNAPMRVELAENIIRKFCPVGGLVCDPFSGSGTTMIAALNCGVSFVGAEILEKYYKQAIGRFETYEHRQNTSTTHKK
jgi:DNA modification methylase